MQPEIQNQDTQYNICKLPSNIAEKEANFVIGVIDASGSMSSYWKEMVKFWNASVAELAKFVITFDNKPRVEKSCHLSENLKDHGGGGTNILGAFEELERQMTEFIMEINFTVIFISDGQDTANGSGLPDKLKKLKGGQGRKINFICLGIQSGFPTSISMTLRELYHTGDSAIPALYLIEYASEKAFFNKFETMKNCFSTSLELEVKPLVKEFPWSAASSNFFEGTWVLLDNKVSELQIAVPGKDKIVHPVPTLRNLNVDGIADCLRGWVQRIHLLEIQGKDPKNPKVYEKTLANIKSISQNAHKIALNLVTRYEKENNLSILKENSTELKSFKLRAVEFMIRNIGVRIKWYIEELAVLAKGLGTQQLSEFEAAKRLGIGTITGKYHQKALALKGITVADFAKIKEEFKKTFENTKLDNTPSTQEPSIFTLQTQKEVFQEPDFLEGLDMCKSQYDLVETFPVVGYSLKVKRFDGSMVNPWKVIVSKLARLHKSIDSMYLAKNQNKFELKIGQGSVEQINAVLPLYSLKDVDLAPLLNSKLFRLAVSFMVVQNIDTYYTEAYLALLANTFVYLLLAERGEWRKGMLQSIYESIKVTYGQDPAFQNWVLKIEEDPFVLFKVQKELNEEHVDITKILIIIFYIAKEKRLAHDRLLHLVDLALCHYTEKAFVTNEFKLAKVIEIQKPDLTGLNIADADKVMTLKDLAKFSEDNVKFVLKKGDTYTLSSKMFTKDESEKQRVTFAHIKAFYQAFNKKAMADDEILYYFAHFIKGKNEANYRSPVIKNLEETKKVILDKLDLQEHNSNKEFIEDVKSAIEELVIEKFQENHFHIKPISKEAFWKLAKEKGWNIKDFDLNYRSGLFRNACQSEKCPLYMKPMKKVEFLDHLKLWKRKMPARFHLLVKTYSEKMDDPHAIFKELNQHIKFLKYKKSDEFVVEYITEILQELRKEKLEAKEEKKEVKA